jgi:hypothetical protein
MDVFIKWSAQRAAHITDRTRYGISAAPLHPDWTQEAVNDPEAFDDPIDPKYPYRRARTGYSEGYGGLITVIYLDLDGDYYGITAYPSNAKQRRKK